MKRGIYFIICSLLICSCSTKQSHLIKATGKVGEVVVVIDKNIWNGNIGNMLRQQLANKYPLLPQDEATFKLYPIPKSSFTDDFNTRRNILCINIKQEHKIPTFTVKRNVWATEQIVIEITAASENEMLKFLKSKSKIIYDTLLNEERERYRQVYSMFREKSLITPIKKFDIDLIIPKGYKLILDTTDFVWITSETPYITLGLFVYTVPCIDTTVFEIKNMLLLRDSVLRKYIPGTLSGTYMTTEYNYPYTEKRFILNQHIAYEIRGLWSMENDFMGGPFVSLSTINKDNKVVVIEGYVYAPKEDKKPYLWQLESILYSLTHR